MELDPAGLDELLRSADLIEECSVLVDPAPLVVRWEGGASALRPGWAEALGTVPTVTVVVGEPGVVPADASAAFDLCVTSRRDAPAPWVTADAGAAERSVAAQPLAALALVAQLRGQEGAAVWTGLATESAAYAGLLGSEAFRSWRERHPRRRVPPAESPPVIVERAGDRLVVTLNRPARHNALDTTMRDELVAALRLGAADDSVRSIELRGTGPSFSSGGDLDEFGTVGNPATAHAIRLSRHPGWSVHRGRGKVWAHLHGACIGAGVEIPAFAGRVTASPDLVASLPELGMGLIPGAGGTVSISRRIGRQRCGWLALTGARIDAATALGWGLVDELIDAS